MHRFEICGHGLPGANECDQGPSRVISTNAYLTISSAYLQVNVNRLFHFSRLITSILARRHIDHRLPHMKSCSANNTTVGLSESLHAANPALAVNG
jgi:hypothetical protein